MKKKYSDKLINNTNQYGMTLIEVMIAMVIVAIIAAIAYPSYQSYIIDGYRSDAQTALTSFARDMERYRADNNSYTGAAAGTTFPAQIPIENNDKRYNISFSTISASSYAIRATPIASTSQDGDGYLELTSTGIKRWDQDNSGATSASENTWKD